MGELDRKGKYYEDFNVGDTHRHWPGKTILDADNHWFTLLTLNSHPIHFDEVYAAGERWGRTLVNSCYTLALVVGMSVRDVSQNAVANLGFDEVRFSKPVFAGDTLYGETKVLDKRISRSNAGCGIVWMETWGINQRQEVVLTFKRSVMVKLKDGGPSDRTAEAP